MGASITFPCQYFVAAFLIATSVFWTSISGSGSFGFSLTCTILSSLAFIVLNYLAWTNMEQIQMKVARKPARKTRAASQTSRFQLELAQMRLKQNAAA